MALGSFSAPYVHSNLYNFNSQLNLSSLDDRSNEGQIRLGAQIQELLHIRDILQREAEAFLGGQDWRTIMTSVDQIEYIFRQIGIDILNSHQAIEILRAKNIRYNKDSLLKAFPQIESDIMTRVNSAVELSSKEAIQLVVEIILSSLPSNGNLEAWKNAFINVMSNKKGTVEQFITSQVKGRLTSEKGKIKKIVEQTLKSRTKSTTKEKNVFIKYFEAEFRSRIAQQELIIPMERAEQYLSEVISKFRSLPSEIFTREASSMIGKLGEDFMTIVMNGNNTLNIVFQTVGMETEESMMSKQHDVFKGTSLSELLNGSIKTHHKGAADSQTDLLLTNTSTGKTVRVQSKNLQAAYHSIVDINKNAFPGMAKLQQETKYINLIAQLQTTQTMHLSEEDLSDLSYLLANEAWFRAKGSYPNAGKARGVSDSSSVLGQTARAVSQLFTKEITNFMGITIDESINVDTSKANSFNSFYLISNKILFPTYLVLNDIIKQLLQIETEFARVQVTINTTSVRGSARAFYESKVAATQPEGLKANGDYSDGNLLAKGTDKGAEIISSLSISNIGLKFDINKLLQTSWSF